MEFSLHLSHLLLPSLANKISYDKHGHKWQKCLCLLVPPPFPRLFHTLDKSWGFQQLAVILIIQSHSVEVHPFLLCQKSEHVTEKIVCQKTSPYQRLHHKTIFCDCESWKVILSQRGRPVLGWTAMRSIIFMPELVKLAPSNVTNQLIVSELFRVTQMSSIKNEASTHN